MQRVHAAMAPPAFVYAPRNPSRCTQQLVLPLAPLAQPGSLDGVAAQVQEHLGSLAETLAGKGAGSVRNALAVGKQIPAGWLARIVSEQLDLQHVRVAGGAELFLELLHGKAHLVGEAALDHGRGVAARIVQEMHSFWLGCQVVEVARDRGANSLPRLWIKRARSLRARGSLSARADRNQAPLAK